MRDTQRNTMRGLILFALLAAPHAALGQFVSVMSGPDAEYHRLFERIARSSFVVKGKVVAIKPVSKRDWQVFDAPNVVRSATIEGTIFTIEIAECLCGRQDFMPAGARTETPPNPLYIYVHSPLRTTGSSDFYPGMAAIPEQLFPGRQYLLFLIPHERQQKLTEVYEMDPALIYYRAYDGYEGTIELPSPAMSRGRADYMAVFVATVTALCEAVRPERVPDKLSRLRALRARAEPRWRDSLEAAIRAIEAIEVHEEPPGP